MRRPIALLTLPLLASLPAIGCFEDGGGAKTHKAPGEDFQFDDQVRITAPTNGATVPPDFTVRWDAGEDVAGLRLEVDGGLLRQFTRIEPGPGYVRIDVDPGAHDLRLVGVDIDGNEVSEHEIVVRASLGDPWVTLTSPADGDTVPNPAHFAVAASDDVDEVEILADDWSLGTVAPGDVLTYRFTGTGFERHIEARAFDDGQLVATHDIRLTIDDGTDPGTSSFNDHVMGYVASYPTDGSYAYWWPSGVDWGGNPNDIYYLGELFSAGDPEHRSFCVGLTFEVFMRSFQDVDRDWGGDGSVNGIGFDELYDFRVDWFVRELYGMGIVDAMENYGIGERVTDWDAVQPGDIVQFWRHSGSGHNAIFIDWERNSSGTIIGLTYWSTQGSTAGIQYNDEYFGSSGSSIDPNFFFVGRVADPDAWMPWY